MSIIDVLQAHYPYLDQTACFISCECGWVEYDSDDEHIKHLAEVIDQHIQEQMYVVIKQVEADTINYMTAHWAGQ